MRNQLLSALQEIIRTAALAAIAVVLEGLATGSFGAIDWNGVQIAVVVAALRGTDKLLHELDIVTPLDVGFLNAFKSKS